MQDLKVTLIQANIHWENINENLKMFSEKISSIKEETDLIVLPEMFTTGFTMNNKCLAEKMNGKTMAWMKEAAKKKKCVVTGSIIVEENKKYYNRLIWMRPDGTFEKYDKRHLFRYANEQKFYSEGHKKLIVDLKGWKICPMVCYDLRFPVWLRNKMRKQKSKVIFEYDVFVIVANWPERRNYPREALLLARAIENQCYVVGVNRVGNDGNGVYHSGDSVVINSKGEIAIKAQPGDEKVFTVSLSYSELEGWRKNFPAWLDADDFELK